MICENSEFQQIAFPLLFFLLFPISTHSINGQGNNGNVLEIGFGKPASFNSPLGKKEQGVVGTMIRKYFTLKNCYQNNTRFGYLFQKPEYPIFAVRKPGQDFRRNIHFSYQPRPGICFMPCLGAGMVGMMTRTHFKCFFLDQPGTPFSHALVQKTFQICQRQS